MMTFDGAWAMFLHCPNKRTAAELLSATIERMDDEIEEDVSEGGEMRNPLSTYTYDALHDLRDWLRDASTIAPASVKVAA